MNAVWLIWLEHQASVLKFMDSSPGFGSEFFLHSLTFQIELTIILYYVKATLFYYPVGPQKTFDFFSI